jgi:hypothetical protein
VYSEDVVVFKMSVLRLQETKLRIGSVVLSVCERASRNCSWTAQIWATYLLSLERHKQPRDKIVGTSLALVLLCTLCWRRNCCVLLGCVLSVCVLYVVEVFNAALGAGYASAGEYLLLWRTHLDYLRRRAEDNSSTLFVQLILYFQEEVKSPGRICYSCVLDCAACVFDRGNSTSVRR